MQARLLSFGHLELEGRAFDHDVVIDSGTIRKRRKKPSRPHRERFGHTPLSTAEEIPWSCPRLIIGTGASGRLPVMQEVLEEAGRRDVAVEMLPTSDACERLSPIPETEVCAILHVTC